MLPPPAISIHQHGVFTTGQALADGWTEAALAWAVRKDRLSRLVHGAYVASDALRGCAIDDHRRHLVIRAVAAQLTIPAAVPSHASAGAMDGLPLLRMPVRPCVTVRPGHTGDARTAHLHRASLAAFDHVRQPREGIRRTTAARTVVDVAREDGVDDAVVIGDAALGRGLTTPTALRSVLAHCATWPGIRRGHDAVARLDGRAESPLESISRLRILEANLPAPRLQANVYDSNGQWLARTDFLWDDVGVVGEADGLEKYDDIASMPLRREKRRQEQLERAGLLVVRWEWSDLTNPHRLTARISDALARGARRPATDRSWLATSS